MTEHQHHWVLGAVDTEVGGQAARQVTVQCTGCDESITRLTARTDAELQAELDVANAEAAGA